MKKLLIFLLIVGGIVVSLNKEKYQTLAHEKVDLFIPQHIQDISYSIWSTVSTQYSTFENRADIWRTEVKTWSINESLALIGEISGTDTISNTESTSPILSNSTVVFSTSSTGLQKLYAVFLFFVTMLFWNFKVFAVWVCILFYIIIKKLKAQFFPKRKKSFFDKINDNVKREMDADWQ